MIIVREVEIRDREVIVPFTHEIPIEVIQEKAVEIKKFIESIMQVPQKIEINKILYETKTEIKTVEVIVEKPVEVDRPVAYTVTENFIEYQPKYVGHDQGGGRHSNREDRGIEA